MRVGSWIFLVLTILVECVWFALVCRIWMLRHVFEIAARSPICICIKQIASIIVVASVALHWILLWEGRGGLPCHAVNATSYFFYSFGGVAIVLRGYRVVIAYNREYRHLSTYVKGKPLALTWGGLIVFFVTRWMLRIITKGYGFMLTRIMTPYGCLYFDDVFISMLFVMSTWPVFFVGKTVMQVRDAFGIGKELVSMIFYGTGVVGWLCVMNGLIMFGAVPDSRPENYISEIAAILTMGNFFVFSVLIPLSKHGKWCTGSKEGAVIPVPGLPFVGGTSLGANQGVLFFARQGGVLCEKFDAFVQENLCMESWDFIIEGVAYEALEDENEQFEKFTHILIEYLQPTSPSEVNISSSMSKRISKFKDRELFSNLGADGRQAILKEPLEEIVRMLEQNLLTKFRQRLDNQSRAELQEVQSALGE
ncbi:unnamed protein product [Ascophyllum nodosum]